MNASSETGRLLAGVFAGAAVLLAGCSTSNASAGLTTTPKTAPASPSGLATTSSPAAPSTSAGPASCKGGALSVVLGPTRAAAGGTAKYQIEFMNISATACSLYGFPSVSFFGKNYRIQVGSAAIRNDGSAEHLVTLPPEGSAVAAVSVVNAKNYPSRCRKTTVKGILVYPPSLTDSVRLPLSGLTCANPNFHVLTVNAVVQGSPPPGGD